MFGTALFHTYKKQDFHLSRIMQINNLTIVDRFTFDLLVEILWHYGLGSFS